jgi:hypothetical protein
MFASTLRQREENVSIEPRVLPDLLVCRTRDLHIPDFAECLVENPGKCRCAVAFGYGFLCEHPDRDTFAQKTKVEDRSF